MSEAGGRIKRQIYIMYPVIIYSTVFTALILDAMPMVIYFGSEFSGPNKILIHHKIPAHWGHNYVAYIVYNLY